MSTEPDLLNICQLATRLSMSRRAVQRLIASRKIPVIRINKRVLRFDLGAVQAALRKLTVREM